MITIVNYGAGNFKSVANMLKKIGVPSIYSDQVEDIEKADKIIIPGVGHYDHGMKQLENSGLIEVLNRKVIDKKTPLLGICLGAQLLGKYSEEGDKQGLGWLNMSVRKFSFGEKMASIKVPHMGWNEITVNKPSPLMNGLEEGARFYFVHSYFMDCEKKEDVLSITDYGYPFCSAVSSENIYGVQFHPEKSHKFGMKLLRNFSEL